MDGGGSIGGGKGPHRCSHDEEGCHCNSPKVSMAQTKMGHFPVVCLLFVDWDCVDRSPLKTGLRKPGAMAHSGETRTGQAEPEGS